MSHEKHEGWFSMMREKTSVVLTKRNTTIKSAKQPRLFNTFNNNMESYGPSGWLSGGERGYGAPSTPPTSPKKQTKPGTPTTPDVCDEHHHDEDPNRPEAWMRVDHFQQARAKPISIPGGNSIKNNPFLQKKLPAKDNNK